MEKDNSFFLEYKGWHIVRKIGEGSYGSVYEIAREDFGYQYKAALKIISIPQSEKDLSQVKNNIGKSDASLEVYYESVASEIVKEFELMYKLKGISNIVSYEDHEIRKHADGIGWDILIRMELLTPLDVYIKSHPLNREDVIHLGIDLCNALERCEMYHIIHRDIKPANIFVSEQRDYKLGDFGIARTLEVHDELLELSQKGTKNYMAPEVYKGERYDFRADIYSLGIVMYRLLNKDVLPFCSLASEPPTARSVALAREKRLRGEPFPYPCDDDTQLADIVLKACSYHPEERYDNPRKMREHLECILQGEYIEELDSKTIKLPQNKIPHTHNNAENLWKKAIIIIPLIALLFVVGVFISVRGKTKNEQKNIISSSSQTEIQTKESPVEVMTGNGESQIQQKDGVSDFQKLLEDHDFISAYKILQDAVKDGKNVDAEVKSFVYACEEELEYKRVRAAMKCLSDNVNTNAAFYKETIQWFCSRDQEEQARLVLSDLRAKGLEGAKLADSISLDNMETNVSKEEKET